MEPCIAGTGRCCSMLNRTVFHARSSHDIYLRPSCGKPCLLLCDVDLVSFSLSNGFCLLKIWWRCVCCTSCRHPFATT